MIKRKSTAEGDELLKQIFKKRGRMRTKYNTYNSFSGKTRASLSLLGIIPFLLVVYLFVIERINLTETAVLFSAFALLSILFGFMIIRRSADQLGNLAKLTAAMESNGKWEPLHINADQEMTDIADNFNSMLRQLESSNREIKEQGIQLMRYARDLALSTERARKEEEIRNRLSRYVGKNLVDMLVNSQEGVLISNERKVVTLLFADIRGFSTMAERMQAEDVVAMLNQFFGTMVDIVFSHNGVLDKFVGDQIMAVFGLISDDGSAPQDAVRAAIKMQEAVQDLMRIRTKCGLETFKIGIGINTGSAIVGNVGSENRMDYTVIGDSVNTAARLEKIARGGEIIIGAKTYSQIREIFKAVKRGQVSVKNKSEKVLCYQIVTQTMNADGIAKPLQN